MKIVTFPEFAIVVDSTSVWVGTHSTAAHLMSAKESEGVYANPIVVNGSFEDLNVG
jgi:hypothetical protein